MPVKAKSLPLSSNVSADTYLWNDASGGNSLAATVSGIYWLEVTNMNCSVRDIVLLQFDTYPVVDLGNITEFCAGESLLLNAGQEGTWQDGSLSDSYEVTQSGTYTVSVANGNCITEAMIEVTALEVPSIDLGPDTSACEGQAVQLQIPAGIDLFSWEEWQS